MSHAHMQRVQCQQRGGDTIARERTFEGAPAAGGGGGGGAQRFYCGVL